MMSIWLVMGAALTRAQTTCQTPDDLPPQLQSGVWGRVAHDSTNNLRAEATTAADIVGQLPSGDIFRVVDGPRWAWTAEGNPATGEYWLIPLAGQDDTFDVIGDEPQGCQKPPDDYTRIQIGYSTLNARTLAMLDHAQALYQAQGGEIRFRESIMQGSYNPGGVSASFGTHDGGGAVDLSVRRRQDYRVLTDEIGLMIRTLRVAGFAAWLRDASELYAGSPIHIHAIAIGDRELSGAARGQIDGPFGYLRGYNGLPQEDGVPLPDNGGEMLICGWMAELGFMDLRGQ
jgi:hypothetical protein